MKTAEEKIALIQEWSQWFYEHTESFYSDVAGDLGAQLAYLYAAIANDTVCEFNGYEDMIDLLQNANVPRTASIWDYIEIVLDEEDYIEED